MKTSNPSAQSGQVRREPLATGKSGLVIVDKPGGITSHDVVARIRRLAGTRRVGHAGTLDPMATGVLVVGVEKATRLLGYLTLSVKEYAATIRLGQSTTTDDAEGEPSGGMSASGVTRAALDAGIGALTGEIMQVPPGVSAVKVNGQRAYKLTRAGAAPEMKPRQVTIYAFVVTRVARDGDYLDVDAVIRCSSGTYIRALARDLGGSLGTGGHLTALRRTAAGAYHIADARTLDELAREYAVTPLEDAAAAAFPRIGLTGAEARRLAHGAQLPLRGFAEAPGPDSHVSGTDRLAPVADGLAHGTGAAAPAAIPGSSPASTAAAHAVAAQTPLAAFGPDGSLVALVKADAGRLRSLAVFTA